MHLSSSGVTSLPPAYLDNLIGSVHFSSEVTTTANQTHLKSNLHFLHLLRACELDIPCRECALLEHTDISGLEWFKNTASQNCVFLRMEISATEANVTPTLPLGELVQEINKDHLTQSEGMFSLALEVRKTGNDL